MAATRIRWLVVAAVTFLMISGAIADLADKYGSYCERLAVVFDNSAEYSSISVSVPFPGSRDFIERADHVTLPQDVLDRWWRGVEQRRETGEQMPKDVDVQFDLVSALFVTDILEMDTHLPGDWSVLWIDSVPLVAWNVKQLQFSIDREQIHGIHDFRITTIAGAFSGDDESTEVIDFVELKRMIPALSWSVGSLVFPTKSAVEVKVQVRAELLTTKEEVSSHRTVSWITNMDVDALGAQDEEQDVTIAFLNGVVCGVHKGISASGQVDLAIPSGKECKSCVVSVAFVRASIVLGFGTLTVDSSRLGFQSIGDSGQQQQRAKDKFNIFLHPKNGSVVVVDADAPMMKIEFQNQESMQHAGGLMHVFVNGTEVFRSPPGQRDHRTSLGTTSFNFDVGLLEDAVNMNGKYPTVITFAHSASWFGQKQISEITVYVKAGSKEDVPIGEKVSSASSLFPELLENSEYGLVWQLLVETKLEHLFPTLHEANCTQAVLGGAKMHELCTSHMSSDDAAVFVAATKEYLARPTPHPVTCPLPSSSSGETYDVWPIQFAAYEENMIDKVERDKLHDFSPIMPAWQGSRFGYSFGKGQESEYYATYAASYYCVTTHKAGWDCNRHYEILGNGCVPYFLGTDKMPRSTMVFFPRELVKEAMNLPGVSFDEEEWEGRIDHSVFNKTRYFELADALLAYTRANLTTKAIARYALSASGNSNAKSVLYFNGGFHIDSPDYGRDMVLHGLRSVLGAGVVDFPPYAPLYNDYVITPSLPLYGHGFTYARRLDASVQIDRSDIQGRIKRGEFDVVVLAGRGLHRDRGAKGSVLAPPLVDFVLKHVPKERVIIIDMADTHEILCEHMERYGRSGTYFRRELFDHCTVIPNPWHDDMRLRLGYHKVLKDQNERAALVGFKLSAPKDDSSVRCVLEDGKPLCTFTFVGEVNMTLLQKWGDGEAAVCKMKGAGGDGEGEEGGGGCGGGGGGNISLEFLFDRAMILSHISATRLADQDGKFNEAAGIWGFGVHKPPAVGIVIIEAVERTSGARLVLRETTMHLYDDEDRLF